MKHGAVSGIRQKNPGEENELQQWMAFLMRVNHDDAEGGNAGRKFGLSISS